jgi:hypothetical protein
MAEWKIYARDVANARQAEVRAFAKLDFRLVMNDAGAWTLEYPHEPTIAAVLDFRGGIVVTRDGVTVFSGGEIRHRQRRVEYGSFDTWRVGGPGDTGQLNQRVVLPVYDAATSGGGAAFSGAAYSEKTGPAENVMRAYVRETVGEAAYLVRQFRTINGLNSGVDGGIGQTIAVKARFDNLLELLQDCARRGGYDADNPLYFRLLQNPTNPSVMDFLVTVPTDRSREVVFARDRKNLLGYTETEQAPGANYWYAGGKGELEQQVIVENQESDSIWRYGYTEAFLNKTNLDDTAALYGAIEGEMPKVRPRSSVEITARDTEAIQAFRDYGIGDRVTCVFDGVARTGIVRELALSIDRSGGSVVSPFVVLDGGPL